MSMVDMQEASVKFSINPCDGAREKSKVSFP